MFSVRDKLDLSITRFFAKSTIIIGTYYAAIGNRIRWPSFVAG